MTEPSTTARNLAGQIVCDWQADSRGIANLTDRIAIALAKKDAEISRLRRIMTGGDQVVLDGLREELVRARAVVEAARDHGCIRPPCTICVALAAYDAARKV